MNIFTSILYFSLFLTESCHMTLSFRPDISNPHLPSLYWKEQPDILILNYLIFQTRHCLKNNRQCWIWRCILDLPHRGSGFYSTPTRATTECIGSVWEDEESIDQMWNACCMQTPTDRDQGRARTVSFFGHGDPSCKSCNWLLSNTQDPVLYVCQLHCSFDLQ